MPRTVPPSKADGGVACLLPFKESHSPKSLEILVGGTQDAPATPHRDTNSIKSGEDAPQLCTQVYIEENQSPPQYMHYV